MNIVPLEQLSAEAFTRVVKTNFRVWIDAVDSVQLELSAVTPPRLSATAGANSQTYENFALVFLGPADRLLPQRIYEFESAVLGRFELFIVPVSRDQNGTRYQATFNRLIMTGEPRV